MDYGTFFFTNIVSVTAFAVCLCVLAMHNRSVTGLKWMAGATVVGLAKLILQGLEGKVPPVASSMMANELYIVSFLMQFIGLRWFIVRRPMRSQWAWGAVGGLIVVYTFMFLARVPYIGNVMNIPFLVVCGFSAWTLFTRATEPFTAVSRVAGTILIADFCVAGYWALLTNLHYMRPWDVLDAHTDVRWLYSLAGMAFLATCMEMCYIWLLVTELDRELSVLARTDPLTGALNRRALEEAALRETARSVRYGNPVCMILFDIDDFKQVNDTYGHAAGDRVLQALVAQVNQILRSPDLLARTGGDEFAILMPETPVRMGVAVAERLRKLLGDLELTEMGHRVPFTISAGVAEFELENGGWEEMMRRADDAMYKAKASGRNAVEAELPEVESSPGLSKIGIVAESRRAESR